MNRPEARKYDPGRDDYAFEHYVEDLERYCDYLEDVKYDLLDGNHRLYEENKQLEKALDKACEELENKSCVKGLGQVGMNYAEWKEWLLNSE